MSPGVAYNENQRVAAGITSMLMLLSTVVVGLRLYIRCVYLGGGSAGWDDVTVFISWVSQFLFDILLHKFADLSTGCHPTYLVYV